MKQPLLIFPYNGNGQEALLSVDPQKFKLIGFIDDTPEKQGQQQYGFVYTRQALIDFPDALVLAVPGSPTSFPLRSQIINELSIAPQRFTTIISPQATVSSHAKIGRNVLIMPGVIITHNAVIGDHVCILPNSVIHHDVKIGNLTLIGSNVSVAGNSTIEDNCYVGSGSRIINGITIGQKSLIGLGTNVIHSVEPKSVMAGNPAKFIRGIE